MDQRLQTLFKYIDDKQQLYVDRLAEAVSIKSVSAWAKNRDECVKMVKWAQSVKTLK